VVLLTDLLLGTGAVPPLIRDAILLLGCVVALVASVVLPGRRQDSR
jgi:hypothetical protein